MERELKIHKLEPVLIEPDQIGLDIEAALVQCDDGVDFALRDVTFEVRVGVRKIYEKKSDAKTGAFSAKGVAVGEVESQFEVVISAKDSVGGMTVRMQKNVENIMRQIEERRRVEEQRARARREEEAEARAAKARGSQKKEQPGDRWSKAGPTSPEEAEAERSAEEEAERQRQAKAEIAKELEYVSSEYRGLATGAFVTILKYQSHPAARRGMLEVASRSPKELTSNIGYFFEAVWAEEVISVLAKLKPAAVLEKFPLFYKCSWSRNVVMQIAVEFPFVALTGIAQYEYQPWAREVALKAAEGDPDSAIKFHDSYQDQPWAGEVLEFAREEKKRKAEEKREQEEAMKLAKAEEKARRMAEKEARKLAEEEEKARQMAEKEARKLAEAEEKARQIAEKEARELAEAERLEAARWTKESLIVMASVDPRCAVENFGKYKDKPWARGILLEILSGSGSQALVDYVEYYRGQSWSFEMYEEAAQKNSDRALQRSCLETLRLLEEWKNTHPEWILWGPSEVPSHTFEFAVSRISDSDVLHGFLESGKGNWEKRRIVFIKLVQLDPQKAMRFFQGDDGKTGHGNLRELIATNFSHLIDLVGDLDTKWNLQDAARKNDPLFGIKQFFRDLLK